MTYATEAAQRRSFARRPAQGAIVCRPVDENDGTVLRGKLVNVSQGGACLAVNGPVAIGQRWRLEIVGKGLSFLGVVRWVSPTGNLQSMGFEFDQPTSPEILFRIGS
jgi:hypothetical protein